MNRRASIIDTVLWVIISFIIVIFLALMVYLWGSVNNAFQGLSDSPGVNITGAVDVTFGVVYPAIVSNLKWWSYMFIFAYALSMLLSNFLARKVHPAIGVFVYLIITIIAFIVAVYISNTYEGLLSDPAIGTTLTSFTGGTYIMLYLPIWAAVIGLFGLFFLVVGIIRDSESGGGFT